MLSAACLLLIVTGCAAASREIPAASPDPAESTSLPHPVITEAFPQHTLLEITRPDLMIYTGPGYDFADTGTLLAEGTCAILSETTDAEGIRWGELASGGWIDLDKAADEAPHIPITLARTDADAAGAMDCILHVIAQRADAVYLLFTPEEALTDVRFGYLDYTAEGFREGAALFTQETLAAKQAFVIGAAFPGDLTSYSLTFRDAAGAGHHYMIYTSGRNGSIVMDALNPAS